jgi:tRNA threonylcarbamoyladenosine biosynthesis protein TsaB
LIETSGQVGQVALAKGEALCGVRPLDQARRHARDLAPALKELLAEQGWLPRQLEAVIVGRGPGSYTGLRVGIMSAKAFAYVTGCRLLAIDTFAAIAHQTPPDLLEVDILADAQQGKVYAQPYTRPAPAMPVQPNGPLLILPFTDWLAKRRADAWVSGPGLRGHQQELSSAGRVVEPAQWDSRAESLLALGLTRFRQGVRDDPWTLEPLYLRPSAAEEQWTARKP